MKLTRVNLVLLLAVCALAAGVAVDAVRSRPTLQPEVTWPAVNPDQLDRMQLSGPDGDVELYRGDDGWELVVPAVEKADQKLAEGVIRAFREPLSPDIRITDRVEDQALYGLGDDERITVRFLSGDEPLLALEIGRALPGGSCFVRPEGDRGVFRARLPSRFRLDKPPSAWRNHAIIDLHAGHVVGVTLTRPDSVIHLQRRTEDWVCTETPELLLDTQATENLARALATLRAQQVLDEPPEGAYDDAPLMVTAMGREGAIKVVEFGGPTEDGGARYARADGEHYVVHEGKYLTFDVDPLRLRDRTIVRLDTVEVEQVTVIQGERRFVAVPSGEYSWSLVEPKGYSIDGRKMAFSLNAVLKLRAHELVDDLTMADAGLDDPGVLTFIIKPIEADPITIRVGAEQDEMHPVQRAGIDQLYRIRRTTARSVSKGFGLTP